MNWVCSCILHVSCRSSLKGFVLQPAAGMIVIMAETYERVLTRRKKRFAEPIVRIGQSQCGGLLKQDGLSGPRKVLSADFIF